MHKDKGFASLVIVFVLVLFVMALAQCDVRHATASTGSSLTTTEGTP
jgi:hypothetical protein